MLITNSFHDWPKNDKQYVQWCAEKFPNVSITPVEDHKSKETVKQTDNHRRNVKSIEVFSERLVVELSNLFVMDSQRQVIQY